jgi:hypothetical protein
MTGEPVGDLIRHEADLIECGLRLQRQGLDLLHAEMRALAGILPAGHPPPGSAAAAPTKWAAGAEARARTEAETEACFDNMPV